MTLAEVYGAEVYGRDFTVRKTVWSKRGDMITCRSVDQSAPQGDRAPTAAPTDPSALVKAASDAA